LQLVAVQVTRLPQVGILLELRLLPGVLARLQLQLGLLLSQQVRQLRQRLILRDLQLLFGQPVRVRLQLLQQVRLSQQRGLLRI